MKHLIPLLAALLLSGCAGYHIGSIKPSSLKKVNTLAVPSLKNETLMPRVEVLIANCIISQIQQDGTYEVTSSDSADAVLDGRIITISRQPIRALIGSVLTTTEFQLDIKIDFKLTDRSTGKELAHRGVTGTTRFFVGGDIQQDEQQAIPLAAQDAAVQIVSYLSEGW